MFFDNPIVISRDELVLEQLVLLLVDRFPSVPLHMYSTSSASVNSSLLMFQNTIVHQLSEPFYGPESLLYNIRSLMKTLHIAWLNKKTRHLLSSLPC